MSARDVGMNRTSSQQRWSLLLRGWLLIILANMVVFGQVGNHEFLSWDDDLHITANPHLRPVSFESLKQFWKQPYEGLYIPMSYTVFAAEAFLSEKFFPERTDEGITAERDLNPRVFHLGSLVLHTLCGLLVLAVLRRLFGHPWPACFGALLFCLHPLQVESVAWVSETRGLLSAFFSLISIWQYLVFVERKRKASQRTTAIPCSGRAIAAYLHYCIATIALTLALLSKPSAVAVPLIALLLYRHFLPGNRRAALVTLIGWLLLATVFIFVNLKEQSQLLFSTPVWVRPLIAGDALAFYLRKLVIPWPLGFDYGRSPEAVMHSWWLYVAWLVPVVVLIACGLSKLRAVLLTAAGIFLAGVLPVLGLVPFAYQYISTVADRYVYLSMLGPSVAVTAILSRSDRRGMLWGTAVLLSVLAVLSHRQAAHWQDDTTFYTHALTVNPRSFVTLNGQGHQLMRAGQVDQAIRKFRSAIAINPKYATGQHNLAVALEGQDRFSEAATHFRAALQVDPARAESHFYLALILERQQQPDEAMAHYRLAIKANPQYVEALNNLGSLLHARGDTAEALHQFRWAVKTDPEFEQARINLGHLLLSAGRVQEAIEQYEIVLRRSPRNPEVHFNLGLIRGRQAALEQALVHFKIALEATPDQPQPDFHRRVVKAFVLTHNALGRSCNKAGRYTQAAKHFRTAIKYDSRFAAAYYNLAETLRAQGMRASAIEMLTTALEIVPHDSEPAQDIRARLKLYQQKPQ